MVEILAAGADYGMLLNDDVLLEDDFRDTLRALVSRLEAPEHASRRYATYRLGRNDAGLVIPRASAARIMGLVCEEPLITQQTDQWQVEKDHPAHGTCRLTYNGTPFEGLVDRGELNTRTSIQEWGADFSNRDAALFHDAVKRKKGRTAPPNSFCASAYPGRVRDPKRLRVQYAAGFTWDGLGAAAAAVPPQDATPDPAKKKVRSRAPDAPRPVLRAPRPPPEP